MSDGLETLIDLAEDRKTQAQRQLGDARTVMASEQAKLNQLEGFADEYRESFNFRAGCGMNPQKLIAYRQFLNQLHTAVSQQSDHYQASDLRVNQCVGDLQDKRKDYESLNLLRQRRRDTVVKIEVKKQQREADDFAMRRFRSFAESE
ncbi:flagellar export protein FliJ [Pelagibaculum spongiae]|nr:flagellar export protein FliJ [Pelagibaculum spongiae]